MTFPLNKPDIGSTNWGNAVNENWDTLNASFVFWSKIVTASKVSITGSGSATLNRLHVVSGTSADYDITISGLSPSTGDVVGFYVADYSSANKQFRLDAGGSVLIAGRTRYLTLVHTNVVLLMWDGTNWQPLVLGLDTPWINAGAISITAVTTNPTKGTTSTDSVHWRRNGSSIQLIYRYIQTSTGSAGSGNYLFGIPIGSIDTAITGTNTSATSASVRSESTYGSFSTFESGQSGDYWGGALPYSSTTLRIRVNNFIGSSSAQLSFASVKYSGTAIFPMTNW